MFRPDECHPFFTLPITALPAADDLVPGSPWAQVWLTALDGSSQAALCCAFTAVPSGELAMEIPTQYAWQAGSLRLLTECEIPIVSESSWLKPTTFRFRCPAMRSRHLCGWETSILYLAPEQLIFACARCAKVPAKEMIPDGTASSRQAVQRSPYRLGLVRSALALVRSL